MRIEDSSNSLVVQKSQVVLVKPSKPTPDVSLSLSTLDEYPEFESIGHMIFVVAPKAYLKDQASYDLVSLLQHALSDVLVYYYPLAGKLHRRSKDNRLELNCKAGDRVPFIRATAECTLSSLNYLDNSDHLDATYQLVPCYEPVKGCEGYDPLALQVTKFACGGITIGMATCHSVCDGVGMAQFFRAMIELASGKTQPTIIPLWERERLSFKNINDKFGVNSKNTDEIVDLPKAGSTATSPYIPIADMITEIVNITAEDITKLKKIVEEEEKLMNVKEEKMVVTTLEILAAHIWRARCRALKLSPCVTTRLTIPIGIRNIMEPPLPEGYYGNAIVSRPLALTAKELSESTLSRLVRLIKDMKRAALDKRYVLKRLNEVERRLEVKDMKVSPRSMDGGSMILSDWRHIGLRYDVCGGLMNIIPLISKKTPFFCVLLPASKTVPGKSGDLRLMIKLPREAMAKFKEEMKAF